MLYVIYSYKTYIPKLVIYQAFKDESRKKGLHTILPEHEYDSSGKKYFYSFNQYNIYYVFLM